MIAAMRSLGRLSEIITDNRTNKLSNSKLASATSFLAGTFFFIYFSATKGFIAELWVIYFGVVVAQSTAHKTIDAFEAVKKSAPPTDAKE